jgi:hypothetical protein
METTARRGKMEIKTKECRVVQVKRITDKDDGTTKDRKRNMNNTNTTLLIEAET